MGKDEAIEKLRRYKKLLTEHLDIEELYLFGSYARGTPHDDSDIDVAVIVKQIEGEYLTLVPLLWKVRRQVDERIEPLLFERGNDPSGFLGQIMDQGIAI